MKRGLLFLLVIVTVLLAGCGKSADSGSGSGGTTGTNQAEEKLSAKISAATIEVTPSSSFPFTVDILSKMPAGGITIKVEAKREDNLVSVYSVQASSTFTSNNFTITSLPPGQIYCTATITITSATTPSNTWTGTFRVLWK